MLHLRIGLEQVGEHRQQAVLIATHLAVLDIEIHDAEKLAVGAGVGNQRLTAGIRHLGGGRHAVVGMAAEDDVDAGDAGGHLQIHVHAVVRDDDDDVGVFILAHPLDDLLHPLVLDSKGPIRDEALRVRNRGVRKGLTDDSHPSIADLLDRVWLEGQAGILVKSAEIGELVIEQGLIPHRNVLGDKIPVELADILDHLLVQVGEFPVAGHDIHAQQVAGADHVLTTAPKGGSGPLPGITAVQQQAVAGPACIADALDQSHQMGEAAYPAELLSRRVIVEIGKGMGIDTARGNLEVLQQVRADQMRRLAECAAETQIDIGLAEIDRVQLSVGVGDVQQADITELGHLIEIRRLPCRGENRRRQHAGGTGKPNELNEFATRD